MDNPETLATQGTQDTSRGQQTLENTNEKSEMDNPEKLVTQGTQDTSQGQQTLENTQGAIRKTILRHWQHRVHRTQVEDNKHQRIHKVQSEMDNPETLATQGTQDTSQGKQTLENTQGAIRNGQS